MLKLHNRRGSLPLVCLVLAAGLVGIDPDARVCSLPARVHGTVTDASTGQAVPQVLMDCAPCPNSTITDQNGDYEFADLAPGDYVLTASGTVLLGYIAPDPVELALGAGDDVTVDFALTRIPPDFKVDVLSVTPAPNAGYAGDTVTVRGNIRFQRDAYEPNKFGRGAYDSTSHVPN